MTKEDLKEFISSLIESPTMRGAAIKTIDMFFSQNVVIPKGTNRHPDADVLHLGIEGSIIESTRHGTFKEDEAILLNPLVRYRIKPSEPTYEWQWLAVPYDVVNLETTISEYMTDTEATKYNKHAVGLFTSIKIEETKRERK
jgi:hypothetical protein